METKMEDPKIEKEKEKTKPRSGRKNKNKINKIISDSLSRLNSLSPWWKSFSLLTFAAFLTRLSYLDYLPGTSWDEVHFGRFANSYIKREFHLDVHPPLGKILIAGASYLTGYNGSFNFSVNTIYDESIPYKMIRSEMAIFGALLVPLSFLTVFELTQSVASSTVGALVVLCDTFLHKINTLILLDPILNFTICSAVLCTFKVHGHRDRPFSKAWWGWLSLTGISLGLVMSVKYVGVFTVLYVGAHTIYQLFQVACDKQHSIWYVIPHTLARALCLILLPILIYLGGFVLQLIILNQSQPYHGAWVHTKFYANLNNTEFDNVTFPKYVTYGSNVTIQSSTLHVGYLESWFFLFPSELTAACQLVATLSIRAPEATEWTIKKVNTSTGSVLDENQPETPPSVVRNGDWVMLTHCGTGRSLRSHNRRAPFTRKLYQVCGYGDDGEGGPFETWQVLIPGTPDGEPLQVFGHDFMLKNYNMKCYLSASDISLPTEWSNEGSKEVACTRNPNYPTLLWNINWINTTKPVGETVLKEHRMGLWDRIKSLHKIMFDMNASLKGGNQDDDQTGSSPWMWPIGYQMQLLASYSDTNNNKTDNTFATAAFNPMIVFANLACLVSFVALATFHYFKVLREPEEEERHIQRRERALSGCSWLFLCWATHFLPFFAMGRILYVHHYCPSYICSCMITGIICNHFSEVISEHGSNRWKKITLNKNYLLAIPALAFIVSYLCFFPLATYIKGEIFEENPINLFLDKFYLGQRWTVFGYRKDLFERRTTVATTLLPLENQENPFLNASLYYESELNSTMPSSIDQELVIAPVPASNYSLLREVREMQGIWEVEDRVGNYTGEVESEEESEVESETESEIGSEIESEIGSEIGNQTSGETWEMGSQIGGIGNQTGEAGNQTGETDNPKDKPVNQTNETGNQTGETINKTGETDTQTDKSGETQSETRQNTIQDSGDQIEESAKEEEGTDTDEGGGKERSHLEEGKKMEEGKKIEEERRDNEERRNEL